MKGVMTKVLTGVMVFAFMASAAAMKNPKEASAKVTVNKVSVKAPSGKVAYVAKGKKVKLETTVKVKPDKKANKKVTYKSANKKIATVSAKGVVKGIKAGKTKITVVSKKNKKKKTTIKVVVKKAAVKKVKLNTKNFVLSAGESKKLKASVTPKKNTCSKVVWYSSNKKVATVSSKGVVKGLQEGSAKITAKAADGSGKKASVTVTIGAGIGSVSVISERLIRVTLTGRKALSAADFIVQTKSGPSSLRYSTMSIQNVTTMDEKNYDITLAGYISVRSYVKVTIPTLVSNRYAEVYVENIPGYEDGDDYDNVQYETGNKDWMAYYSEYWSINNSNSVGQITYTDVRGLPSGLKAYISKDKTSVRVWGKFNNVENGTVATLVGIDEKRRTFTKKYIFVIGSNEHMVAVAEPPCTQLSYRPDDPKTVKNEESGFAPSEYTLMNYVHTSGGPGDWDCEITYNGEALDKLLYDDNGERLALDAGTYNFNVVYKDQTTKNVLASAVVTIRLEDGVTVSGTVRDASGQPVKEAWVGGYTKSNEYGRYCNINAETEMDGTYSTRVLPGDYFTYCCVGGDYNSYDLTVGNKFSGNTTKNFSLPLYRVTFGLNVPGAVGYASSAVYIIDSYGDTFEVDTYQNQYDKDRSMYAYLEAGSYEIYCSNYYYMGRISAYGEVSEYTDSYGNKKYTLDNKLGEYKVETKAFTVSGNCNIMLNATKIDEQEVEDFSLPKK